MAQIFHRGLNSIGRVSLLGGPILFASIAIGLAIFFRSSYATGRYDVVEQPVPFSHLHHVGQLGIDCRYCHGGVETSHFAGIPATKVCMNCHQQMWVGADMLGVVRDSWQSQNGDEQKPIVWQKVHNVPHFAYFNHSAHVGKGVGCVECHGQVDEMPLMYQSKTLLMEWCLKCHRDPASRLRPVDEVTSMTWTPAKKTINPETGEAYPTDPAELGRVLMKQHGVRDSLTITSCSMCHR